MYMCLNLNGFSLLSRSHLFLGCLAKGQGSAELSSTLAGRSVPADASAMDPVPCEEKGSEAEGKRGNSMPEELRISISNAMAKRPERGNSQRLAGQSLRYHSVI
jgi:hypothetical protein